MPEVARMMADVEEGGLGRRSSYETESDVDRLVEEILEDEEFSSDDSFDELDAMHWYGHLSGMGPEKFLDFHHKRGFPIVNFYDMFHLEKPAIIAEDLEVAMADLVKAVTPLYEELIEDDRRSEVSVMGGDDYYSSSSDSIEFYEEEEEELTDDAQAERLQKANDFLLELREKGPLCFADDHDLKGTLASDFLATLGYALPTSIRYLEHKDQWGFIKRFLIKYVYQRPRLPTMTSFEDAVEAIRSATRIMIVTGAGISVSCGIPDFRSENGLYASIREQYDLPEPECMFDIEYFRIDPSPFYMLAKELFPGQFKPSISHYFIRALEQEGKLLRNFTQNIDTLEQVAGIENVVYCHGSFSTATCIQCKTKYTCEQLKALMEVSKIPYCDGGCEEGVVKPDIVFFGEPLPSEFDERLEEDIEKADLVIVIGSSMKVQPVSMIPDLLHPSVPQILINRERLDHYFDIELIGDADVILGEISRRLSWNQLGTHDVCQTEPMMQFVEPNITLFSGCTLGGRPPIPEPEQDGCLLAEALLGDENPQSHALLHQIFPKPE